MATSGIAVGLPEQVNSLGVQIYAERYPSESILGRAYLLLESEGLIPVIWHDPNPPTLSGFLANAKRRDVIYWSGWVTGPDGPPELAGIGWCGDIQLIGDDKRKAVCGMAFLRRFQTRTLCQELASLFIDDAFEKCGIEVMYGYSPVPNRASVRFTQKMGFTRLCVAPMFGSWRGAPCDVVMTSMTREQWNRGEHHGRQ